MAAYLDPFSLANAIRSASLYYSSTSRALFGGIWAALLSMKGIEELKDGLAEQGNAILIGNCIIFASIVITIRLVLRRTLF